MLLFPYCAVEFFPSQQSSMASTQTSEKTPAVSEKQRLKLAKFALKKEKQEQQAQQEIDGAAKDKKLKKQDAPPAVGSQDWIEETPAGRKKILKPLDDEFHKAYIPKVVESAWYSFWEDQGLFKPQTQENGRLKPKGKYVIAIPPPNVCDSCIDRRIFTPAKCHS